jgi:hypothetical protein
MPLPIFAQAVLEKAALDSAAAGGSQASLEFMDALGDGRIVLWILIAAVILLIVKTFRRPAQ